MASVRDGAVFSNPVIPGFNPDPTVCVVPATNSTPTTFFLSTSTFEYFPGCAIYSSTDLINWKHIGHALTRRSQIEMRTVEPGAGSWASTLRYRPKEKRWYLANGLFQRYRPTSDERIFPRGFYVWTDNIWNDNAWSDPVYFDNPGFDQDLFWDDDDKVYLSTTVRMSKRTPGLKMKDFAIHISEIDITTGRTLTPPQVIRESPHGIAEGSHIVRKGRYYYLFTAEGGTEAGHQEWVFRSDIGPYGPWEGQGQALWYNGPEEEVQRTGHCDIFEDGDGRWWAVMLGVRPVKSEGKYIEPQMGRETFLVRVDWVDDWPIFNQGRNITLRTVGREHVQKAPVANAVGVRWRADLSKSSLELGWYHKNTPIKPCYSLTERPGYLRLFGNCFDLNSPESPAMLLRKQTSYNESFRAEMIFKPSRAGYESGITVWWSQYSYATIGIAAVREDDGSLAVPTIVTREPTGKVSELKVGYPVLRSKTSACPGLDLDHHVQLAIAAQPTKYEMSLDIGGITANVSFKSEDLTIYPPVGGAFCGVMFGVYSCGQSEPVLDPSDFTNIEILETEER
ncbi:Non-reducing end alpha-L-arabinofuranosidase BoGH43B [Colletotrichum siamense]|uniref:Non-reducing end alpha-L-arabinofuranosidase BoGH43B n=1 Tax=Colletotrichum siamense TaxID=690259 RepID=A0A9P5ECJ2_COLSI|nr:Non-reducing end alpha-L-arabinofuranosidase BoGH43B [Colletotrichum siamense]KAF4844677.1 Non-reducing end alpha-L-arabinofuranosidase BoGH43B [Colletotrichum siamense]KAF4855050.1 Non-reducing end alpha-L-arabinofuranosidase BoGH43B [Colletotrichum siamense]